MKEQTLHCSKFTAGAALSEDMTSHISRMTLFVTIGSIKTNTKPINEWRTPTCYSLTASSIEDIEVRKQSITIIS